MFEQAEQLFDRFTLILAKYYDSGLFFNDSSKIILRKLFMDKLIHSFVRLYRNRIFIYLLLIFVNIERPIRRKTR